MRERSERVAVKKTLTSNKPPLNRGNEGKTLSSERDKRKSNVTVFPCFVEFCLLNGLGNRFLISMHECVKKHLRVCICVCKSIFVCVCANVSPLLLFFLFFLDFCLFVCSYCFVFFKLYHNVPLTFQCS